MLAGGGRSLEEFQWKGWGDILLLVNCSLSTEFPVTELQRQAGARGKTQDGFGFGLHLGDGHQGRLRLRTANFLSFRGKGLSSSADAPHVNFTHLVGYKSTSLLSGAAQNPQLSSKPSDSQESGGAAPSESDTLLIFSAFCKMGIFCAGKSL